MKIVIGTGPDAATLDAWRAAYPTVDFPVPPTEAERIAAMPDADAYLGRISREAFLAAGPQLRWVHSTGAGIESIAAIPELVESDVTVTNTRGGHAPCIAGIPSRCCSRSRAACRRISTIKGSIAGSQRVRLPGCAS